MMSYRLIGNHYTDGTVKVKRHYTKYPCPWFTMVFGSV